ncbi:hypothetical protein Droror1_Dr00017983 [Drosera rotundifolia]
MLLLSVLFSPPLSSFLFSLDEAAALLLPPSTTRLEMHEDAFVKFLGRPVSIFCSSRTVKGWDSRVPKIISFGKAKRKRQSGYYETTRCFKSIALASLYLRYVGNLKERSLKDQMAKDPTEVIRKAVMRMLPRNKLRDDRDRKLRIFADGEHPFGDRGPEAYIMPPRKVREMRPLARRALIRAQKRAEQQEQGVGPVKKSDRKGEDKFDVIA